MDGADKRVTVTPARGIAGCVLAAASLVLGGVIGNAAASIPFAVLFVLLGFFRFQPRNGAVATALTMAWCGVMVLAAPFYPNFMLAPEKFGIILPEMLMLNAFFALAIWGLSASVTGRWKGAYAVTSLVMLIAAFINTYVFRFRGNEVSPADIFYIQTAINVAGQYNFRVTEKMLVCTLVWLTSVFALGSLPAIPRGKPRRALRLVTLAVSAALGILYFLGTDLVPYHTWSCEGTIRSGFFLNFSAGIRRSMVQPPEGYSWEVVDALAEDAEAEETDGEGRKPHIIVVMNESFADFTTLTGEMPRTNSPVTPFFDSLTENAVKGHALTSVFGGTTANAEFELLTGGTMAFLPMGSCPYQQFIRGEMPGLVSSLRAQGYDCMSTHPYEASGWNRTKVYPLLGFERSTFDEAYKGAREVRAYVSDSAVYLYIMQQMEKAQQSEQPLFLFAVTMQNHGGYDYAGKNFTADVELEGYEPGYPDADQYFSLIRESDRALEQLVGMLERFEEDTVLLFFGDHYPALKNECYQALRGGDAQTLEMRMGAYTVPYLIWANYDLEEKQGGVTSLNYLGTMLTKAAGLELSPYQQFQLQAMEHIPAINSLGYYSPSKGGYAEFDQAEGEEKQWLTYCEMVQYNLLFDAQNRSGAMFGTGE